jgi:sugar-specific transcriptional regulator TrmB
MFIIDKRKMNMQRRLDEIAVEIKKLKEEEIRGKRATPGAPKSHHKKGWKTMAMTY